MLDEVIKRLTKTCNNKPPNRHKKNNPPSQSQTAIDAGKRISLEMDGCTDGIYLSFRSNFIPRAC